MYSKNKVTSYKLLAHAEKQFFSKLVFECSDKLVFINQAKRVHELIIVSKSSYYKSAIKDAKTDQKALFSVVNKLLHTERMDDLPS